MGGCEPWISNDRIAGRQGRANAAEDASYPGSLRGKTGDVCGRLKTRGEIGVTDAPVKSRPPLSTRGNGGQKKRVMGLEPTTFTLAT
jgi:hypothetical protein